MKKSSVSSKRDNVKLLEIGGICDEQQRYTAYKVLTDGRFTPHGAESFVELKRGDIILMWISKITSDERVQCWLDKEGEVIKWYQHGVLVPEKIKEIVQKCYRRGR